MKASSIVPVIFLFLFFGVNLTAQAQAGASMSYTIVITENTLDYGDSYGDNYDDRGLNMPTSCKESERLLDVVKTASSEIQTATNNRGVKNIYKLEKNLKVADLLANVSVHDEDGRLTIIMEYN